MKRGQLDSKFRKITTTAALGLVVILAGARATYAALSEDDYFKSLRIADQYVRKLKDRNGDGTVSGSLALGARGPRRSDLKSLQGRTYHVGDQWEVIAWRTDTMRAAAMMSAPSDHPPLRQEMAAFRYTVISVAPGADGVAEIRIEPIDAYGLSSFDPRVKSLTIRTDAKLSQYTKTYVFSVPGMMGMKKEVTVPVSADGIRSGITPLELFPIDMPRLELGEGTRVTKLPELPPALQPIAKSSGYKLRPDEGSWFEESDFFGRPIQMLWRTGEPWPAYLKTPYGVAILVSRGGGA